MLGIERRKKIVELLQKDQRVYISEISQLFNVTDETLRRDLEKLENNGILTRTYGGAILNKHTNEEIPFQARTSINQELKQQIALKAAPLINNGNTLMIDASSTCLELIKAITNKQNLTIITNSVEIPFEFVNSNHNIISTGGSLRPRSFALVGPVAQNIIKNYYVDIAVMSCKGLSPDKGIMESNEQDSEFKKGMMQQAEKVILLADHTKFNRPAFTTVFGFEAVDYLVTDSLPDEEWMDLLQKYNVRVIY